jgi:hypothetical protein
MCSDVDDTRFQQYNMADATHPTPHRTPHATSHPTPSMSKSPELPLSKSPPGSF